MGYFGKSGSNASVIIFTASISTIQLFSSVTLKQVLLAYAPAASPTVSKAQDQTSGPSKTQDSDPIKTRIQPNRGSFDSSWTIHGELQVTNSDAKLSAALTTGTLTLSETLGLEISNIQFTVDYVLSNVPDSGASPASQGQQVSHAPKFNMDLSGQAKIGPITAVASVVFDTEIPGVLVVQVPGELNVSDLFNQIFDANIPSDVLDISFSQFLMYYAWRNVASAPAEVKPSNGSYATGFHAEAHASIYGVQFLLALDILRGDDNERGIKFTGTKATPIEFLGLVLHGKSDATQGPSFSFSTQKANKGCSFEAGLKLFGTDLGSITLAYSSQPSHFSGTVDIKADFIPGGSASVSFEILEKNGKHTLRFVDLPTVMDDVIQAVHIIENIEKFSAADGSKCGPLKLAFDQLTTKLHIKVTMADSQKDGSLDQNAEEPSKDTSGSVSSLQLEIDGYFDIAVVGKSVSNITFNPIPISIEVPKSFTLDAFATSLADSLANAAEE
ncbi:hypothetical protein BN14_09779 [Rhizoctonia solani AG-1 IB]|uniref:Uncharacterized protein n=1 Tax=Thanatephorus cucumeris (strain AG1-IB / isolate 7/3/14) TaxID=1108050 RepID=M5C899_THACB|nr:hypothetical protein BN14_09779 [Rhizoctonia solani AG-1 IB]